MNYPIPDDKLPLFKSCHFLSDIVWEIGTPTHGGPVRAYSSDRSGAYVIPFRVTFRNGAWRNAMTGEALLCKIEGWK